jgi:predicted HNH restriction endonuclease
LLCPNCHSQTHNYCKREELRNGKSLQTWVPEGKPFE